MLPAPNRTLAEAALQKDPHPRTDRQHRPAGGGSEWRTRGAIIGTGNDGARRRIGFARACRGRRAISRKSAYRSACEGSRGGVRDREFKGTVSSIAGIVGQGRIIPRSAQVQRRRCSRGPCGPARRRPPRRRAASRRLFQFRASERPIVRSRRRGLNLRRHRSSRFNFLRCAEYSRT